MTDELQALSFESQGLGLPQHPIHGFSHEQTNGVLLPAGSGSGDPAGILPAQPADWTGGWAGAVDGGPVLTEKLGRVSTPGPGIRRLWLHLPSLLQVKSRAASVTGVASTKMDNAAYCRRI